MKTALFILIYGGVVACVGFTTMTLFNIPAYATAIFSVPAVLLADRIGEDFRVRLFPPRNTSAQDDDS